MRIGSSEEELIMTRTHKKLALVALTAFVAEAALIFCVAINFKGNMLNPIKAAPEDYSISFTRSNAYSAVDKTYVYENSTTVGNKVYLISTGGNSRASGAIASIPSSADSTVADPVLKFYRDSDGANPFRHQSLNSISVTTNGNVTLSILTSADGVYYKEKGTLDCTSSGATFSNFNEYDRFVGITGSTRASFQRNITNVSLNYECDSGASDSPFVSGTFEAVVKDKSNLDSPISFVFNSDGYGYYTFYYNTDAENKYSLFSWSYNQYTDSLAFSYMSSGAGSTAGMSGTGNNTAYQGYRLFGKFSAGQTNSAALIDGDLHIFFFEKQSDTQYEYRRSSANIVDRVL